MNIFLREMKAHRKALIFWCIGMLLLVISGMAKYQAYSGTGQALNELWSQMPKAVQAVMGLGSFDLTKASGFYGVLFLYIVLMAAIHAALIGANIIAKEEQDKTVEFLFAKPVSRNTIITSKLLAALANILILNIVTSFSSFGIVNSYAKGEEVTGDIVVLMIGLFIIQLIFMALGSGIAAKRKNAKAAASAATGVMFVTFILSIIIDINDKLENLKYLTPFKYFDAKQLMYGGGFDPVFVILALVIIVILISATYVFYKKRDLSI